LYLGEILLFPLVDSTLVDKVIDLCFLYVAYFDILPKNNKEQTVVENGGPSMINVLIHR
jgi:hypothetical protein